MTENTSKAPENQDVNNLLARIKELESAVQHAKADERVSLNLAVETLRINSALKEQIKDLEESIKQPTIPAGKQEIGISWMSKIVILIRQVGRPMRAKEIIRDLLEMDKAEGEERLKWICDRESYMSVVICKGAKSGRIKPFKVGGTRGSYYAVEELVDKDGNLNEEMRRQLI